MSGWLSYADLEIRLYEKSDKGYQVELSLDHTLQQKGFAPANWPEWLADESASQYGQKLFEWLLADATVREAWDRFGGQKPQRRVRLRIDDDAPELHQLAWEQLRDSAAEQDLAAGEATPFSRYLSGRWLPGTPILARPIKVLVAIANPDDLTAYNLTAIQVESEWQALEGAVSEAAGDEEIQLTLLSQPCTLGALETELKRGYHVLHFIGHGKFSDRESRALLYLADDNNKVAPVYDAAFSEMLERQLAGTDSRREDKLRLVFLASCETAKSSPSEAYRGMARSLVHAGVPAVVAMQDLVPVVTARQFAQVFYRQLLRHGLVDLAANEARSAVMTAGLPGTVIPVVYCRLLDGQLFGRRGRITSENDDDFWPFLLERIQSGKCIPFLGPRVTDGILPDRSSIAQRLADKYKYPMKDRHDLVRVAQFLSVSSPDTLRQDYARLLKSSLFSFLDQTPTDEEKKKIREESFSALTEYLDWSNRIRQIQENEIHHLLAELPFPLYLTTGFDNFMAAALAERDGEPPRRLGLRWQCPDASSPQWVLTPPPSPENPAVIHLNGYDEDEQFNHLILAEDDYLSHFVRLSRDQDFILPSNVLGTLADSSYLFLGYELEDWEFRGVLRGLIARITQLNPQRKRHVGVQLSPVQTQDPRNIENYLKRYLGTYNIDIYWGSSRQFVTELAERWRQYEAEDDVL